MMLTYGGKVTIREFDTKKENGYTEKKIQYWYLHKAKWNLSKKLSPHICNSVGENLAENPTTFPPRGDNSWCKLKMMMRVVIDLVYVYIAGWGSPTGWNNCNNIVNNPNILIQGLKLAPEKHCLRCCNVIKLRHNDGVLFVSVFGAQFQCSWGQTRRLWDKC